MSFGRFRLLPTNIHSINFSVINCPDTPWHIVNWIQLSCWENGGYCVQYSQTVESLILPPFICKMYWKGNFSGKISVIDVCFRKAKGKDNINKKLSTRADSHTCLGIILYKRFHLLKCCSSLQKTCVIHGIDGDRKEGDRIRPTGSACWCNLALLNWKVKEDSTCVKETDLVVGD